MGVTWNCERELVDLIVHHQLAGCRTVLDAVLMIQHCSVKGISLLEFVREWCVFNGDLMPRKDVQVELVAVTASEDVPVGAAVAVASEPAPVAPPAPAPAVPVRWKYAEWRSEPVSSKRLEKVRLHIAEVLAADGEHETYLRMLRQFESKLAAVVEQPGSLPLVADDDDEPDGEQVAVVPVDDLPANEVDADAEADPEIEAETDSDCETSAGPVTALAPAPPEEQAEIAAVLANPAAAAAAGSSSEPAARDRLGRELVTSAVLDELIQLGGRLGMNRVECTEMLCTKFKLRRAEDLQASVATAVIANMRSKLAAAK